MIFSMVVLAGIASADIADAAFGRERIHRFMLSSSLASRSEEEYPRSADREQPVGSL
ncbi:hypothetical protein [Microvirga rosea]|uniref:hypothetical protein n=1 Tax=Microvirga rosea TaxID=2715425 RepID=UPI001D0A30D4|nr:hypothetical protein [Microvirga rosea]MCB8820598.1 hypothetical protein [Microvirga rosea]